MKAFDIPAINNQLEVLAKSLGLKHDQLTTSELEKLIEVLPLYEFESKGFRQKISRFKYKGKNFAVAHIGVGIPAEAVYEFNSNHWCINSKQLVRITGLVNPTKYSSLIGRIVEVIPCPCKGFKFSAGIWDSIPLDNFHYDTI